MLRGGRHFSRSLALEHADMAAADAAFGSKEPGDPQRADHQQNVQQGSMPNDDVVFVSPTVSAILDHS